VPATAWALPTGALGFTPLKAIVTMETCVGGKTLAVIVLVRVVATDTQAATLVDWEETALKASVDASGHWMVANGYVSMMLTTTSPGIVPEGSRVVGALLPWVPEPNEVAVPTACGTEVDVLTVIVERADDPTWTRVKTATSVPNEIANVDQPRKGRGKRPKGTPEARGRFSPRSGDLRSENSVPEKCRKLFTMAGPLRCSGQGRTPGAYGPTGRPILNFGSPANSGSPVALRLHLAMDLPFSVESCDTAVLRK